jgi:uncharacterized protein
MTPGYRRLLKWSRLVHVYLTLFGLGLILFFAVTGFMLNHEDWFMPTEPRSSSTEGGVPTALLQPVDRLGVVEALRNQFGATGAMNSFREDDESVQVEFVRPGMRAVAEVRVNDGKTTLQTESRGFSAVLTDLHKGKSAGWIWGLVIDGVCVLFLIIAVTGLVLWWSLRGRGKGGTTMIVLGAAIAVAIFWQFVP